MTIDEGSEHAADARVTGSVAAWTRALGPDADFTELRFAGDRRLADELLSGFTEAAVGRLQRAVA